MNTQQLKQKILDLAIKGQLVAQDSQDEPAAVLLERIRAEKQELIKAKKIKKDKNASYITRDTIPYQQYTEHFADGTIKDITEEIPFEIPENWAWCRLGEVISLLSGQDLSPKEYNDKQKGIPYIIGASNFEKNNLIINRWTELPKNIALRKDILITCKGTVGEINILREKEVHIARQIMALKPIFISNHYLSIFLKNKVSNLKQTANGLIPGISREDILLQIFPLPPLSEQQRIVAKVEELLALVDEIETNKTDLATYIKQTKAKVLDMAVRGVLTQSSPQPSRKERGTKGEGAESDIHNEHYHDAPFPIPKHWEWKKLGVVCSFENGFAFNSSDYSDNGTPLIRISNIQNNKIDIENTVYIEKEVEDKFVVKKGDLLIAMSGATTGKMGVYQNDEKAFLNQRVGNIRVKDDLILSPEFRNIFMKTQSDKILKLAYGGAQPNISGKMISSLPIPLPPLSEQKAIVERIESIFEVLEDIETKLAPSPKGGVINH